MLRAYNTLMTHIKKRSLIVIGGAFLFFAIFVMMAMQPAMTTQSGIEPQATTQINQPMAYENTNITWSAYNSNMARNEFLNGTGSANYINAEPSVFYGNYISINQSDIIAPKELQNDTLGNMNKAWDSSKWGTGNTVVNTSVSSSWSNISGTGEEKLTADVLGTQNGENPDIEYTIDSSNYSSQNLEYDYLTLIISASMIRNSGAAAEVTLWNSSGYGYTVTPLIVSGTYYFSENLAQIQKDDGYKTTWNTTVGKGYSSVIDIAIEIGLPPKAPDGIYSVTLNGLAFTTFPITFGSNVSGAVTSQNAGRLQLSVFNPDITNISIVNNGYTEALSMPVEMAQNYTETQNQINTGNYIEETTTQASFDYPMGTDISYTQTNITMALNGINGYQIPVFDINGISLSNNLNNMTGNKTLYAGTVNPNQPTNVIYQTYYTATQWNSITSPPFILSVQGIEYYWWVFVISTFGAIGVFAGLKSYATGKEENLRIPPKVR